MDRNRIVLERKSVDTVKNVLKFVGNGRSIVVIKLLSSLISRISLCALTYLYNERNYKTTTLGIYKVKNTTYVRYNIESHSEIINISLGLMRKKFHQQQ